MREGQKRDLARKLRSGMTDAEHRLWRHLRRRQLSGCRFRRQHPVGPYVVDFACLEKRLVIEVDGGQHNGSPFDQRRDACLRSMGFDVLRFWNHDVLGNVDGALQVILAALASTHPHPNPPPQAGEGV